MTEPGFRKAWRTCGYGCPDTLSEAAPRPASEPARCDSQHERYGRCDLTAGHAGYHARDVFDYIWTGGV